MAVHAGPAPAEPPSRREIRAAERAREAAEAAAREAAQVMARRFEPQVEERPAPAAVTPQPAAVPTSRRALRQAAAASATSTGAHPTVPVPGAGTGPLRTAPVPAPAAARQALPATPAVSAPEPSAPRVAPAVSAPAQPALPATPVVSAPEPSAPRAADAVRTEVLSAPSRRQGRAHPPARRSVAPRMAVLGAMSALTIAAPLTGLAGAGQEQAVAADVMAGGSALELLDAAAAAEVLAGAPASLLADPSAATRATVAAASRAAERQSLACTPLDGASGTRAAVTATTDRLVMPVRSGAYRLTSGYGYRAYPVRGLHTGTDFAAPVGTPIHAVADGVVEYVGVGKDGRSSMLIIIRHELEGETFWTWSGHMYPDGLLVREGQSVKAGDVIAEVGNNGRSTGPHLHFEVHLDEDLTTVDPLPWLKERGAVGLPAGC